jgi:predicted amidohydrolase
MIQSSETPATLRVAIAQGESVGARDVRWERTERLAERAAAAGARLIVFPETWLPGYPIWLDVCRDLNLWDSPSLKSAFASYWEASVTIGDATCHLLAALAKRLRCALVVGISERSRPGDGAGTLYNAILTFGEDGSLVNHHRKLMPTHTERLVWGLGDNVGVRPTTVGGVPMGSLICWEHWMPLPRQALHEAGEVIHAALWPMVKEMNHVASRHYAFEGRCFVLAAGAIMRTDALPSGVTLADGIVTNGLLLRGGSAVIGPDGSYLVEPVYDREEVLVADLPLRRVTEEQLTLNVAGHYSRPDCYRLETITLPRARATGGDPGESEPPR